MMISVFDVFKIGIGPSSSHTVGPMKAAKAFIDGIQGNGLLERIARLEVRLLGSLAWTGKGHGTDRAAILGLAGLEPATLDPDEAEIIMANLPETRTLRAAGIRDIGFLIDRDIVFDFETQPTAHPNTMACRAFDASGICLAEETWLSVGGGFIARAGEDPETAAAEAPCPYPFRNAAELLEIACRASLPIHAIIFANEASRRPAAEIEEHLQTVAAIMFSCIERGLAAEGMLPGKLKVNRRARALFGTLEEERLGNSRRPNEAMEYVSAFAIAVNEENAAGSRVVTAPTNGAAGVVPAVLRYYRDFCRDASPAGIRAFLLTATAIGGLFKLNSSISGAEVGCQGEVGVACSMAAAGLVAAFGGSNEEIENAAEIGMEHHLGMTCDPIGGLVQIPCIERNAFGAIKAINAASLAMRGKGKHLVTLDQVIDTMRQTGLDMNTKYKETSQGGLAVNWVEC